MEKIQCDSLIFDMDGTLWDAVDSYARIWNETFAECGIQAPAVTRERLIGQMGRHLEDILGEICPDLCGDAAFLKRLDENETRMMPVLGGRLYDGVADTIRALARTHRLYMVSNCGSKGLDNFMSYTGLKGCFEDWLSHGASGRTKAENIRMLVDRYGLQTPYYVGDTASDARAAHDAGVGMVWCRYGFGKVDDADVVIDNFASLRDVF